MNLSFDYYFCWFSSTQKLRTAAGASKLAHVKIFHLLHLTSVRICLVDLPRQRARMSNGPGAAEVKKSFLHFEATHSSLWFLMTSGHHCRVLRKTLSWRNRVPVGPNFVSGSPMGALQKPSLEDLVVWNASIHPFVSPSLRSHLFSPCKHFPQ